MTSSSSSVPPGFPTGSRVMPEGQHAPRFDDFIPEDPLTNHEYDGIREYDNPTPGWWHAIFFATIIFSALYIMAYSWNKAANTPEQDLADRQVAEDTKLFGKLGELKGDEATIQQMRADKKMMQVAKSMFESNCAACHAKDGGGINGVNLTDNHYKNAKNIVDLFTVINNGANSGAMPAWKDRMQNNQRVILAAYAANLRGTTPSKAKDPEGEVIPAWPEGTVGGDKASK